MMAVSEAVALHKRKSPFSVATRRMTSASNQVAIELPSLGRDVTPICLIAHIDFPSSGLSQANGAQIARPHTAAPTFATNPMARSFDNSSAISSIQRDSICSREHFRLAYNGREA